MKVKHMILPENTIIASGPVIIEENKVLLNREQKKSGLTPWFFPGGKLEHFDQSLEEACKREAKEELNLDIEIIRPLAPILLKRPDNNGYAILIHYLAQRISEDKDLKKGDGIVEWAWFDIHQLPDDCAPNVKEVIYKYLEEPK